MTSSRRWLLLGLVAAAACSGDVGPAAPSDASTPTGVLATPLGMRLVRVTWTPVAGATGYRVERRENLSGAFATVTQVTPGSASLWDDASVSPATIYGYRVRSLTALGTPSDPSLVFGTVTPPEPGLILLTSLLSAYGDSSGVTASVVSPQGDTSRVGLGSSDSRLLSSLAPGTYRVTLAGIDANCTTPDLLSQTAQITDQGVNTQQRLSWRLDCRDPDRGRIRVRVATQGDSLDPDGYLVTVDGIASDATLPDSLRAYLNNVRVFTTSSIEALFDLLRPGSYTVVLSDLAANCAAGGPLLVDTAVVALSDILITYPVTCIGQIDDPNLPFVWRNTWSPAAAGTGQPVKLDVALDVSAQPAQTVTAVQALLEFDSTVVRFDSVSSPLPWSMTANTVNKGKLSWLSYVTGNGQGGAPVVGRFWFTVLGGSGTSTKTRSTLLVASDLNGNDLLPQIRREEATFSASGGGSNLPPVARPGGPYAGAAGATLNFSGASSSDPDGSIVSYAWTFGDGGTASGATVTHQYAAAGTFTVTLTVTDNQGASATAGTTASVTGGGNQAPIANPGGPYAGTPGNPVSFSGVGSSDPDGTVVSYGWDFGDGATGSGSAPSHSYAAAGSYTVALTVTDNLGATATASTQATIIAGGAGLTWASQFGVVNPADSVVAMTVTLDLTANLSQTPGVEEVASWVVDSLKWDPTVMTYFSFNFGSGGFGSVNPTFASQGKLQFSGGIPAGNGTGVVAIATVRFKVIGAPGRSTTTATRLGPVQGTAQTGFFGYTPFITLDEDTLTP